MHHNLKPFKGALPTVSHIPPWFHGQLEDFRAIPQAILERRMDKHHNKAKVQYLVQWEGFPPSDATWESLSSLKKITVIFQEKLEDNFL